MREDLSLSPLTDKGHETQIGIGWLPHNWKTAELDTTPGTRTQCFLFAFPCGKFSVLLHKAGSQYKFISGLGPNRVTEKHKNVVFLGFGLSFWVGELDRHKGKQWFWFFGFFFFFWSC